MIYDFLYLILFVYIGYEAFHELFFTLTSKHLAAKQKYRSLKEGSNLKYIEYLYRTRLQLLPQSILRKEVLVGLLMYTVHHHFIVELVSEVGDKEMQHLFEDWTNVGIHLAMIIAVITVYIKFKNTKTSHSFLK